MQATGVFFNGLLLAAISTVLSVNDDSGSNATLQPFEPTREELYKQFAQELQVVAGAQEHTRHIYDTATSNMRQQVSYSVLDKLQGLMDSVGTYVEDVLEIAENDGKETAVKPCVAYKDVEAESAVKESLEEMRHCVEKIAAEGEDFAQQVGRVVSQVEDLLKQLVTTMEECLAAKNDSEDEKERVKACLLSDRVKELISLKEKAFKPLKLIMNTVFKMEKEPPNCISELFQKTENEILEIKNSIRSCAKQSESEELDYCVIP